MKMRLRYRMAVLTLLILLPVVATSVVALVRLASGYLWEEAELDAVLVLAFTAAGRHARVDLVQVGVPERLYETLMSGWPVRYWQPWRAYLEGRRA